MKFGKQIQNQAHPEWAHHYMNYKGLKKIIGNPKVTTNGVLTVASSEITPNENTEIEDINGGAEGESPRQAHRAAFFFRVDRELEKVNSFYLKKEAEFQVRMRSLVDKRKVTQLRDDAHKQTAIWRTLQEAFIQYQQDLDKLQQFVEINGTGFRKILKKWDKRSRSTTKDLYLSRQVKVQKCFNKEVIAELADACATNLAEIEAFLESQKNKPNENDKEGGVSDNSAIDVEAELFNAVMAGQVNMVQEVIHRRQELNPIEGEVDFISPVFWRACSESALLDSLQLLLNTNLVNFNYVDDISHRTCLHEATINGNLGLVKICLEHHALVDVADIYGRTPLHYAAMYGYLDCTKLLLNSNSDPSPIDHEGFTALLYAISGGYVDCVEILVSALGELGSDAGRALLLASQYGHKDILVLLLGKMGTIDVSADHSNGLYPLHLASREGHAEVCLLLAQHGADLNAIDSDRGWTPLFHAASEGHLDCIKILVNAGCKMDIVDENGLTPVYYAAYEGHAECVEFLLESGCPAIVTPTPGLTEDQGEEEPPQGDPIDDIPSLLLPPPLLPFRIYGHNYLDNRYLVQLHLGLPSTENGQARPPVHLYGNSKISSLKLILTPRPTDAQGSEPQSVILPLAEGREAYTFEVNSLESFGMEFTIFPTFGSKVLGKAVALPAHFNESANKAVTCPLFDSHLKVVGEVNFTFSLVKPYNNVNLEVGGRIETYWKSPAQDLPTPLLGTNGDIASLVTSSSLAQEYIQLSVQMTTDFKPIVFNDLCINISGLAISPFSISLDQFKSLQPSSDVSINKIKSISASPESRYQLRELIHNSYLTLEEALLLLPSGLGVCLDVKYPYETQHIIKTTLPEINQFIDTILDIVYKHAKSQKVQSSFIFSSFEPIVCNALNWKQPNYPVFVSTHGGWDNSPISSKTHLRSLKSAIQFAKSNNLLGIISSSTPLIQVPQLIQHVKESGFLLASFGSSNEKSDLLVKQQEASGVDAIIIKGILHYGGGNSSLVAIG